MARCTACAAAAVAPLTCLPHATLLHCCALQALILIKLFPASLLSVAIFGVLDNIARLACGSVIGQFVDRCAVCDCDLASSTPWHRVLPQQQRVCVSCLRDEGHRSCNSSQVDMTVIMPTCWQVHHWLAGQHNGILRVRV